MEKLQKLDSATKHLDRGLEAAALICLVISVLGAIINVFLRYVLDMSYQIIEEICRYAIIYGAFLYVGPLIKKGDHLKMDILQGFLKGKSKSINNLLISILLFAAFVYLSWACIIWSLSLLSLNVMTVSGIMLMFIPALAIPIGMLLGSLYAFIQIIHDVYILRYYKTTEDETSIKMETGSSNQLV
ncbi:TRAP-type C4-dicarboxylate transport system permease small subunit [Neobacillus niacini]|uniref:TRAP transporter small permease n=1 Tax=Neobacillus niacini TaxID=86668 RepID=UPI00278820F7|nr:TRAP transporter small permease subunit [Neobacillus niacini]MDQ1001814.1 TRAP-type C4-dicarboxylate transport system permease small subunit [Neobacillus niacini]